MAMEAMRETLYARLQAEGARDSQKAVWAALWNEAQRHPGKPLPCPVCFTHMSQPNRVVALENIGPMARGRCEVCRNEFEWIDNDG